MRADGTTVMGGERKKVRWRYFRLVDYKSGIRKMERIQELRNTLQLCSVLPQSLDFQLIKP
jgi:hypothetical protein